MTRRWRSPAAILLIAIAVVLGGYHLSGARAPEGGPSSPRTPRVDPLRGPAAGPPSAADAALRPPTADEIPLAAPATARPGIPRTEEIDRLAAVAGRQIGERLRRLLDVEEYFHGDTPAEFERIEVSAETIRTLLDLLESPDAAVRRDAAIRLAAARLEEADLPLLRAALEREMLDATSPESRHGALALAYALAAQGSRDGPARLESALLAGERANDDAFRREAVLVLGMIGDPESAPALREVLRDDPLAAVRAHAAQGLGTLGGEENQAALAESLVRDEGIEVRAWAALGYGRSAPVDGSAAEPLRASARSDAEPIVRGAASYGLSRAGGPGTSRALVEAFYADPAEMARIGALAGLARRPDLGDAKREFLDGEGATFLAGVAAESADHVSVYFAARTMARIPGEVARNGIVAVLDSTHPDWVRTEAVRSLGRQAGAGAIPALRASLEKETRDAVRKAIEQEIRRLEKAGR